MRKKKRKRNKNLLSHMSCNYDQTKLTRPLPEYSRAVVFIGGRGWCVAMRAPDNTFDFITSFRKRRRARRLSMQLASCLYAHRLVIDA